MTKRRILIQPPPENNEDRTGNLQFEYDENWAPDYVEFYHVLKVLDFEELGKHVAPLLSMYFSKEEIELTRIHQKHHKK